MKKNLWVKLISVILIVVFVCTFASCDLIGIGDESGSDSNVDVIVNEGGYTGVKAEDLTPSADLTFTMASDKKGYQLKSATKCKDEQVVIPSTYTGADGVTLPVTNIAAGAFKNSKTVVSVYIPDSVTNISDYAFYICKKLFGGRVHFF